MRLALQQPFFFPYLTYFDLANRVDKWIFFDTVQHVSWASRNRILHQKIGLQYIIVPVMKHHQNTPINEIVIPSDINWQSKIMGQLYHYRRAPYYKDVMSFLEDCFFCLDNNLSHCNIKFFKKTCHLLGIDLTFQVLSEMNLKLSGENKLPGDWGLRVSHALGADEYINMHIPGIEALFERERFLEKGIKLTVYPFKSFEYKCGKYQYIPDLSIIDVLMWNSPQEIKEYLDKMKFRTS